MTQQSMAQEGSGIERRASSKQLTELLAANARLLKDAARRKRECDTLENTMKEQARVYLTQLLPALREVAQTVQEIRSLFEALLGSTSRLSKTSKTQVRRIYRELDEAGLLEEPSLPLDVCDPGDSGSDSSPHSEPEQPRHASADKPAGPESDALRSVFRRLAMATHPDRAKGSADEKARTEAMKALTQAYEAGDLAQLLELEREWLSGELTPSDGDADEHRCSVLKRVNSELRAQIRGLNERLQELRKLAQPALIPRSKRGKPSPSGVEGLLLLVQQSLVELREVRDFTARFRDGGLSVQEFARGPERPTSR